MSSSVATSPRSNQGSERARRTGGSKRWLYQKSAAAFRWVHIYISMLSFASLMFFAFTGLTLNHPTWLGGSDQVIRDESGELPEHLKKALSVEPLDELGIAEWLRAEHRLKGYVAEFTDDELELMVVYKGPGYSADVFVTRDTGEYMLTKSESSFIAVLNDLHKGRDSGPGWAILIDVSAIVMMVMSVSGFGLLLYLKRRRFMGLIVAAIGTIAMLAAWLLFVS